MGKLTRPQGAKLFTIRGDPYPFKRGARVWVYHGDGTNVPMVTDGERLCYVRTARLSAAVPPRERLARWLRRRLAGRFASIVIDEFSGDSSNESL